MSPHKPHFHLGDSWVVESEDESVEESAKHEVDQSSRDLSPRVRSSRQPTRRQHSPEDPDFIMPSLDSNTIAGSWADATGINNRDQISSRVLDKAHERRRRSSRKTSIKDSTQNRAKNQVPAHAERPVRNSESELLVLDHLSVMISWVFEVLGKALRILKTPISYALAVWLLFVMGIVARNLITSSVYSSLSPLCRIPGTSFLNLPFCAGHFSSSERPPLVEFDQLMTVQSKFEEVLEETAASVSLPMDMKRGEASIRDLRQLVKYSQLHSKQELVLEFDGFIETAKIASYDLQRFNSHIGRAVDSVVSTCRWTNRVLDDIQLHDKSRGAIGRLLAPFQAVQFSESALLDQYIKHTQIIEEEINKLIDEAQALLMVLNSLEDRLDIIHGVVTRDNAHAKAQKEEILLEIWTYIGGNRGKLNKMDKQLNLLHQVGIYRKSAYAHVSGTILKLQAIGAGIEDLRERVGSPELLRDRLHVPLSVHMDNIQKGVERLEEGRQSAKRLENEHVRQTLERGRMEGTLIDT